MKNRNGSVRSTQAAAPALVAILCLLVPGSAALSQPFPSFMLDSTFARCPGLTNATGVRVAFGPDTGLVVWTSRFRLLGVRVHQNGVPLDSVSFDISGTDREGLVVGTPGVAWGGGKFLVVWADVEAMKYALVDPGGSILARAMLQDKEWSGSGGLAVAFDGTNFLVSWIGGNESLGSGALFCRVSPDGTVLDHPPRFVAPHAVGEEGEVALCYHSDRYLAAWSDGDPSGLIGVSANFIFPDGSIADSVGFCIRSAAGAGNPAVTHDRSNFVVTWEEWTNRGFVKLARVTDSGTVLDTTGVLIDSFSSTQTALVSNGDTTLVVFRRDSVWNRDSVTLVAVRIDAAMNRLDAEPVKLSVPGHPGWGDAAEEPSAVLCGDDYFITWEQPLTTEDFYQALCRRMNRHGEVLDSTPVVLSYGAATQGHPDVASDGESFFAVWSDTRRDSIAPAYSLLGARFTADGALLDPSPIWVDSTRYEVHPALAHGGGCYFVAWYESRGVSAKRITPAGVVLDSVPLRMPGLGEVRGNPSVAFGDSAFLVVWPTWSSVHGCRTTPTGGLLDTTPLQLVVTQTQGPEYPRVAFDGVNFLVARQDGDDMHRCVRVSQEGVILDTADITIGAAAAVPEVAYGGSVYLVVDNVTSKCWLVTRSGKLLGAVPHPDLQYAHVVFDGTNFMLLCQLRDSSGQSTNGLGAMRITPDGRVLDSMPLSLVEPESAFASAHDAAMSINAAGRVAAVFGCRERSPYLTQRIRAATFPAIVGIGSQRDGTAPAMFRVQPNPASRTAALSFSLGQAGPVQVTAFDATGRRCASLFSGRMKAGNQSLALDTRRLANGIYFLRLEAGTARHSTRLVVAR